MINGAIGDYFGSVHEGYQWDTKNQDFMSLDIKRSPILKKIDFNQRTSFSITDDTICSLGLLKAFFYKSDPAITLADFCKDFRAVGFGSNFEKWIDNPISYNSFANGSLMRLGFLEYVKSDFLEIVLEYTNISHNHDESISAVLDYLDIYTDFDKLDFISRKRNVIKSVEDYHNDKKFVISAKDTLNQAISILKESSTFEEIIINSMYIGGDTDTLAAIACELSSFSAPLHLRYAVEQSIIFGTNQKYKDVLNSILNIN